MIWQYDDYPTSATKRVSGTIEIEMTAPPKLPITKIGAHADPSTIARPLVEAQWRVKGKASDDLKRFVRGRYWPRIQTALLAAYLREIDMHDQAAIYDQLAGMK